MAQKPHLYDPRTGYPLDAAGHRTLLAYARRQYVAALARWQQAEDVLDRVTRRDAVRRWQRRAKLAYDAKERWRQIVQDLEDQLRRKVIEFELKFSYEGRQRSKNANWRSNINLRMRWQGVRMPTPMQTRKAFLHVLAYKQAPRGWQYAVIDWMNEKYATQGWKTGRWRGSGRSEPDVKGEGNMVEQRTDPRELDWVETIWVGGGLTLDDLDITVIGEVEED